MFSQNSDEKNDSDLQTSPSTNTKDSDYSDIIYYIIWDRTLVENLEKPES